MKNYTLEDKGSVHLRIVTPAGSREHPSSSPLWIDFKGLKVLQKVVFHPDFSSLFFGHTTFLISRHAGVMLDFSQEIEYKEAPEGSSNLNSHYEDGVEAVLNNNYGLYRCNVYAKCTQADSAILQKME